MDKAQQTQFNSLYQQHISELRRQGKAESTIDGYSRAVRRITEYFDLCPDQLTQKHLKDNFTSLVKPHSWGTPCLKAFDEYVFLHGNAKRTLQAIRWLLKVVVPTIVKKTRPQFMCEKCCSPMSIIGFTQIKYRTG